MPAAFRWQLWPRGFDLSRFEAEPAMLEPVPARPRDHTPARCREHTNRRLHALQVHAEIELAVQAELNRITA